MLFCVRRFTETRSATCLYRLSPSHSLSRSHFSGSEERREDKHRGSPSFAMRQRRHNPHTYHLHPKRSTPYYNHPKTPPSYLRFHRFREINISLIYFAYYCNIPQLLLVRLFHQPSLFTTLALSVALLPSTRHGKTTGEFNLHRCLTVENHFK